MSYLWRVLIAVSIGVVAAVVVYSTTPPTEIAAVETATILEDGRTLEVRTPFDSDLHNKPLPDRAEVHTYPNPDEEFDELIVWVTLERHYPKNSTLSGCVESMSTQVRNPSPMVGAFVALAGPTTVSRDGCREVYTTVLAEPLDPTTPIRLVGPEREPPIAVVQVRSERAAAVGILTALVLVSFLLLVRRPTPTEEPAAAGFV